MTAEEHTSLLFLCDSIRAAPSKARELLAFARQLSDGKARSEQYNAYIDRLCDSVDVLEEERLIRDEIR